MEKIVKNNRTLTKLSDELFSLSEEDKYNGIILSELEDSQLSLIINKYRSFYNFYGKIQNSLYQEFKGIPFLLRIAFEYASNKKIEFLNFSIKELFERYFDELLSPITNKTISKVFLIEIAKLFYQYNTPFISIERIIKIINFDIGII